MKKIFSNENIRNIRLYVNHEIMNQGGKDKKDVSKCRFIHTERVALISYQILGMYIDEYKRTKGKYTKDSKISKSDFKQVKRIVKSKAEKSVIFMGIIHDLFKMTEEVKDSHGILAAEWFTEYCKLNKYQMKGILKDIRDAIKNHSSKGDMKNKNIFYKILCDADIISKYSVENAYEKSIKLNMTMLESIKNSMNIIENKNGYKGHTPFFNHLRKINKNKVLNELKEKKK